MRTTWIKQRLVGTAAGHWLVRARELLDLFSAVRSDPEEGGLLSQNAIARQLLGRLCLPTQTFVDVGAHLGSMIAEVRHHQRNIPVVAIEADPDKRAHLEARFPDADVPPYAAGEREESVTLYVDTVQPGFTSLLGRTGGDIREISVPVRRLDDLISGDVDVGLVKIDVEGWEVGVVRGATALLERCRPVVQFESAVRPDAPQTALAGPLFDAFQERRYQIFVPNRVAHEGPPLSREGFLEAHFYPRRALNYFAIAEERRIDVRDRARAILDAS